MTAMTTKLTQDTLKQIEAYLTERYPSMVSGKARRNTSLETDLLERMVRIEDELKNQRELMLQMFAQVDKRLDLMEKTMDRRFEDVDRRFEDVNKRFEDVNKRFDDVNKRFEDVNKRFDDVNKRFSMIMWAMGIGFSLTIAFFSGALALFR